MNSIKEANIKNRTYYFFDDNNKIKIDKKSYKDILIYGVGYVTPNSVKPLYLIINKRNGYNEVSNGNKYLKLVPADDKLRQTRKTEELWDKTTYLARSTNNKSNSNKSNLILMTFYL